MNLLKWLFNSKQFDLNKIGSLISGQTNVTGNLQFSGNLTIGGEIVGDFITNTTDRPVATTKTATTEFILVLAEGVLIIKKFDAVVENLIVRGEVKITESDLQVVKSIHVTSTGSLIVENGHVIRCNSLVVDSGGHVDGRVFVNQWPRPSIATVQPVKENECNAL